VSIFDSRKPSPKTAPPPEDRTLIRDALLALLQPYKRGATKAQHVRIRRLEERLRRFPAPTGIVPHVQRIAESAQFGGGKRGAAPLRRETASADLVGLAISALRGMRSVALVDQRLEIMLDRLQDSVPQNPVAADVHRIQNQLGNVERLGHIVRRQTIQEREELSMMLQDMSDALKAAGTHSATMTQGIDRIARTLAAAPMPEELAETRRHLLGGLKGIYQETSRLRSGLEVAEARAKELEDIVTKTTAELIEARQHAATDPLTNLANRAALDRALAEGIVSARRLRRPLALVMVDIDHFKRVNDTYGHPIGDVVIQSLSDKMREAVRDRDTVARFGGEEFAMVLDGAPEAVAFAVADRVRQRVEQEPIHIPREETSDDEPLEVHITISAGIAILQEAETSEGLLQRADRYLYAAKHAGRNQVQPQP
jgi:diguanylate cyclase (GGDEF)-like protein